MRPLRARVAGPVVLFRQRHTRGPHGLRVTVSVGTASPQPAQDPGEGDVLVRVANRGRWPVTLKDFGLRLPGAVDLLLSDKRAWVNAFPHTLEPQASLDLVLPQRELAQVRLVHAGRARMRPYVVLGNGATVYGGRLPPAGLTPHA
jgi:hypothetical protein